MAENITVEELREKIENMKNEDFITVPLKGSEDHGEE